MPFDLDALELEENNAPFEFVFGGETFTIAHHYDPRIFRRFSSGDIVGALELMIGKEQFDRLDKIDKPFDERHMQRIMEEWSKFDGTTSGEAKASSRSSKSTGGRSKRTSNGSTASHSPVSSVDVSKA